MHSCYQSYVLYLPCAHLSCDLFCVTQQKTRGPTDLFAFIKLTGSLIQTNTPGAAKLGYMHLFASQSIDAPDWGLLYSKYIQDLASSIIFSISFQLSVIPQSTYIFSSCQASCSFHSLLPVSPDTPPHYQNLYKQSPPIPSSAHFLKSITGI